MDRNAERLETRQRSTREILSRLDEEDWWTIIMDADGELWMKHPNMFMDSFPWLKLTGDMRYLSSTGLAVAGTYRTVSDSEAATLLTSSDLTELADAFGYNGNHATTSETD